MSHSIRAIIAKNKVAQEFCERWLKAKANNLPQEFGLIFIPDDLLDEICELKDSSKDDPFSEFDFLSESLKEILDDLSFSGEVGYIETEYFGGTGYQAAIVLDKGKTIYGPLKTSDEWNGQKYIQNPGGIRAVNGALRNLGVWVKDDKDEWDMLELFRYRHMDD